jgi:hypothetical protein
VTLALLSVAKQTPAAFTLPLLVGRSPFFLFF